MDISMSMLEWFLKDLEHTSRIEQDERCIKRLRFLFYEEQPIDPEYLYIAGMKEEISDARFSDSYMILNRKSYIIFKSVDMNALLNRLLMAFDYFNNWEKKLLELKAGKAPVKEFIRLSDEIFHNPMSICDLNFNLYASSDPGNYKLDPVWRSMEESLSVTKAPMDDPYYDADTGEKITELTNEPRLVRNVYQGGAPVIMLYIDRNQEHAGTLSILTENEEMRTINMQLAKVLAEAVSGSSELAESIAFKSKNQMLKDLLDGNLAAQDVNNLIKAEVPCPWRLLCLSNAIRTDAMNRHGMIARITKYKKECVVTIYADSVLVLMSEKDIDPEMKFFKELFDLDRLNILVSASFTELDRIRLIHRQLEYAGQIYHKKAGIFFAQRTAVLYYMDNLSRDPLTPLFFHPALTILENYDKSNETDLTNTLITYLSLEMSGAKTAEKLFIHPNSMKYRLKRIRELTDLSFENPEEMEHLRISCWLWKYRGQHR